MPKSSEVSVDKYFESPSKGATAAVGAGKTPTLQIRLITQLTDLASGLPSA